MAVSAATTTAMMMRAVTNDDPGLRGSSGPAAPAITTSPTSTIAAPTRSMVRRLTPGRNRGAPSTEMTTAAPMIVCTRKSGAYW